MHDCMRLISARKAFLNKHGGSIHLLGLEGFLFEGTVARLLGYVLGLQVWQSHSNHIVIT